MTLADFVRMLRANFRLILVFASLGLALAFAYTLTQPVVYTASSVGYVVSTNGSVDPAGADSAAMSKLPIYASVVGTTPVAERVIKELKLDATPAAIAPRFSVVPSDSAPTMTILATGPSPEEAQRLANAVIGATAAEVKALDTYGRPEGADLSTPLTLVPQSLAELPGAPSSPDYRKNLAVGLGIGALLGLAIGFLRKQLDSKIRSVADMEALIHRSVLSVVPEDRELDRVGAAGLVSSRTGPVAEALRQLRTNLRFVDVDKPPRSIVITSANAGEGKSVVTANLARVLAAAGEEVVLIDADLRRPMLATLFDLDPGVGLTQVLAGDIVLADALQDSETENLSVLTAGRIPPNPSELLGSHKMQALIRGLVEDDFLVMIDAPPLLPVTDAGLLSGLVDGAILVVAVGRTYTEQAKLAVKILNQVGGRVLGAVLNRASARTIGSVVYGYGYESYSSDYYSAYVYRDGERVEAKEAGPKRNRVKRTTSRVGRG